MQLLHTYTYTHTHTHTHTNTYTHAHMWLSNIHIICNSADNLRMYRALCVSFLGNLLDPFTRGPVFMWPVLSLNIPWWKTGNLLHYEKSDFLNFSICSCWTANQKGSYTYSRCGTNFKHNVNIIGLYIDTYIHTCIHTHIHTYVYTYTHISFFLLTVHLDIIV